MGHRLLAEQPGDSELPEGDYSGARALFRKVRRSCGNWRQRLACEALGVWGKPGGGRWSVGTSRRPRGAAEQLGKR